MKPSNFSFKLLQALHKSKIQTLYLCHLSPAYIAYRGLFVALAWLQIHTPGYFDIFHSDISCVPMQDLLLVPPKNQTSTKAGVHLLYVTILLPSL